MVKYFLHGQAHTGCQIGPAPECFPDRNIRGQAYPESGMTGGKAEFWSEHHTSHHEGCSTTKNLDFCKAVKTISKQSAPLS